MILVDIVLLFVILFEIHYLASRIIVLSQLYGLGCSKIDFIETNEVLE